MGYVGQPQTHALRHFTHCELLTRSFTWCRVRREGAATGAEEAAAVNAARAARGSPA